MATTRILTQAERLAALRAAVDAGRVAQQQLPWASNVVRRVVVRPARVVHANNLPGGAP